MLSWTACLASSVIWLWYGLEKHDRNIFLPRLGWIPLDSAAMIGVFLPVMNFIQEVRRLTKQLRRVFCGVEDMRLGARNSNSFSAWISWRSDVQEAASSFLPVPWSYNPAPRRRYELHPAGVSEGCGRHCRRDSAGITALRRTLGRCHSWIYPGTPAWLVAQRLITNRAAPGGGI